MKLIIVLSVVAWSRCAKLDRTYLPPSHAQSSAGSNFLQAPDSDLARGSSNNFGQVNDFRGNSNNGNGFNNGFQGNALNGNGFPGNSFNQNSNGNGDFGGNVNTFNRPERPQAAYERNAAILRQDSQNDGETYSYAYETENGIYAEENGVATNGVEAQGSYSYTGDDGQVYTVRYTADQNGFVPVGDHLPTPPPVPEDILKALEQNARDEAAGIYDDGSYNEGKYGDDSQYNGNNFDNGNNYNTNNYIGSNNNDNNNYNNNNGNSFNRDFDGSDEDSIVTNSAVFRASQAPSEGSSGFNGATKAYLPPVQSQRSQFGARSRSRPSFNARDGYNY